MIMKTYTITVNGNVYTVTVEEGANAGAANAAAAPAAPVKPAVPTVKEEAPASAGSIRVEAPMSGKILAVKASAGQSVKKGEVIVVLEAMKMENDIVAPQDGTVVSVSVTAGQQVESGETLATLQ